MDNLDEITRGVDELIAAYKEAQDAGNQALLNKCRYAAEKRAAELLDLYKQNDMDERVVIIQFQRIKLSKLLREDDLHYGNAFSQHASSSIFNPGISSPTTVDRPNSPIRLPMQLRSGYQAPHHTPYPNTLTATQQFIGGTPPHNTITNTEAKQPPNSSKHKKPLYDWEVRHTPKAPPVKNISHSLPVMSPLSHVVEFSVLLSPGEYAQLQEQKWKYTHNSMKLSTGGQFSYLEKNTGHLAYFVKDEDNTQSPFLASSAPYVDPFHHPSIRSVNKAKWVSSQDFKALGPT